MASVLNRKLCVSESHVGGMSLSLKTVMLAFYLESSVHGASPQGIIVVAKCQAGGSKGIKMSLSFS